MIVKRIKELLLAVGLLPILVQPALAHVVWFIPQDDNYQLVFGHPEIGPDPTIAVERFRSATAYDINRNPVPLEVSIQDGINVFPQGDIAALIAYFDNDRLSVRNPDGTTSRITRAEAEALNFVDVTNSVKYTKNFSDWSEPLSQPFGFPLEIIALRNPLEVTEGDIFPIQVSFEGNLITNALVEYEGVTLSLNADGTTYNVPIGHGGLQPIEASYIVTTPSNLRVDHATTLTAQRSAQSVPEPSALLGLGALATLALARKQSKGLKF